MLRCTYCCSSALVSCGGSAAIRTHLSSPPQAPWLGPSWVSAPGTSHWLLGLHRVKMDSPNPFFWDLLWLAVFGLGPLLLGWRFLKGPPHAPSSRPAVLVFCLSAVAIDVAAVSLLPTARGAPQTVLFGKESSASEIMLAIAAADGSVVSTDASGPIWVVRFESPLAGNQLYQSGAIIVGGAPAAGCLTYSVPVVAPGV